jgi:hypothetical protein
LCDGSHGEFVTCGPHCTLTLTLRVGKFGTPHVCEQRRSPRGIAEIDAVPDNRFMSSRSLIPLLLVAAVVFACGPRAHSEASPKKDSAIVLQTGAPARVVAARPRTVDAKAQVQAQLYVRATETSVRLALHVVNTGKRRVEITFPSGQTYEFVILDSLGREVWRWGKGRMFTQALRNKLLAGGESLDLEETLDDAALPPGRYTAKGTLTSVNYPLARQTEFTIDHATIAAR